MKLIKKFNPFLRNFQYINIDSGSTKIDVYIQATEPILPVNKKIAIWQDTSSGRKLIIYRDDVGGQTSVEMS